jgi:hypothetical protein
MNNVHIHHRWKLIFGSLMFVNSFFGTIWPIFTGEIFVPEGWFAVAVFVFALATLVCSIYVVGIYARVVFLRIQARGGALPEDVQRHSLGGRKLLRGPSRYAHASGGCRRRIGRHAHGTAAHPDIPHADRGTCRTRLSGVRAESCTLECRKDEVVNNYRSGLRVRRLAIKYKSAPERTRFFIG